MMVIDKYVYDLEWSNLSTGERGIDTFDRRKDAHKLAFEKYNEGIVVKVRKRLFNSPSSMIVE